MSGSEDDRRAPDAAALREIAEVAIQIARDAGELLVTRFGARHDETAKGHAHNLVTEADQMSEALIDGALAARLPGHAVVAEERGGQVGAGITWWVDPLDGTNNYAHGYPVFAVNLAASIGDQVLVGVTYDPIRDELFSAVQGQGAWLNGVRLTVSARDSLLEALVATGFPYDKATNRDNNLAEFTRVTPLVRGMRRSGSAALDLAYVAAGRLDAYWEHGTRPWDVAAGVLLINEAGGTVTDLAGGAPRLDGGRFVASNGRIHAELLTVIGAARAEAGLATAAGAQVGRV
jgi:myo-inositol-1(or 4)-monophosphatase